MYKPTDEERRRLRNNFSHHAPHGGQAERYTKIRILHHELAVQLSEYCPQSRELSLALTHLEESVFWSCAAIARNEVPPRKEGSV